MSHIVFLEVDKEDESKVKAQFPDATIIAEEKTGDELVEVCKDAEVVSVFIYSPMPKEVLKQLPKLKLICVRAVGFDHIDVDYCKEKSITVCHVPDYGSHVIAEHVFAMLLSTIRHINEADARVEKGEFDYHGLRGMALRGKTIGIVGTGRIGAHVAQIANGFGMRILAVDRCRKPELEEGYGVHYVEFNELCEQSNIITLHAPSTPETFHMVNDVALHRMHRGVILVNTARGDLIDTAALISAIKGNKIGYALLDVLEHEKNFEDNKELIEFPNVVTTPHIAFYSEESMANMFNDCFESIHQWQKGEQPVHTVKPRTKVCDMPGVKKGKG